MDAPLPVDASAAHLSAAGFCDALLPAMVADLGRACARVSAVVQLYVKCEHDDLARVITLDEAPSVVAGEHDEPDLVLAIDERVLPALLTGTLDVEAALAAGDLEADGDLRVLSRIAALFDGGSSPMSTRLAAMAGRT